MVRLLTTLLSSQQSYKHFPFLATNINDALRRGIDMLSSKGESSRAPVIVFLTDGQPTAGVTRRGDILSNVRTKNEMEIPIFSLAFGRGADYQFTKKLAAQNNGLGRKIYEDSDSDLQISGFYREISTVLLKNVSFKYLDPNVTSLTETNFNTYFNGTEIVICGIGGFGVWEEQDPTHMLRSNELPVTVKGKSVNGATITLGLPDPIVITDDQTVQTDSQDFTMNLTRAGDYAEITEKLWAYLTIKQLLREKDAVTSEKEIQRLDKEITDMSLKVIMTL